MDYVGPSTSRSKQETEHGRQSFYWYPVRVDTRHTSKTTVVSAVLQLLLHLLRVGGLSLSMDGLSHVRSYWFLKTLLVYIIIN